MNTSSAFRAIVAREMNRLGHSQQSLAKAAGVGQGEISKILSGKLVALTANTMDKVLAPLGMELAFAVRKDSLPAAGDK